MCVKELTSSGHVFFYITGLYEKKICQMGYWAGKIQHPFCVASFGVLSSWEHHEKNQYHHSHRE